MRTNYQVNATPCFQVLTQAQIEAIYFSALRVLEETGVRVYEPEGVEVAVSGGATVENGRLVKVPSWVVDKARATLPGMVSIAGPAEASGERKYRMDLHSNSAYYGTGSGASFVLDPRTGQRRPALYQDAKDMARIVESLPNIDFYTPLGLGQDKGAGPHDRWTYLAVLEGTNKPANITAADTEGLKAQFEMACLRLGGQDEWRKTPCFSLASEPVSPLSHSQGAVQKLLFCADNSIPVIYASRPVAGDNAPATLAGQLVLALADALFAVVLSQLRRPGAQLIMGGLGFVTGSPETALFNAAYADIAKWLGVPVYSVAGCTDAKVFDEQAAMEATLSLAMAALYGGNMIHGLGSLESGLTSSVEMLVASDEIISMVKRIMRGMAVDEETMALEVMNRVGPGGHYLGEDHTLRHFRTEFWRPKLIDRQRFENWRDSGSKRMSERVHDRVIELLEAEEQPILDEKMWRELRRICESGKT